MRCILCGRPTQPAVLLAGNAVGPKCAARAGLLERARKNKGRGHVTLYRGARIPRADERTLDLFTEGAA